MKTRIRSRIVGACVLAFVIAAVVGIKLSARTSLMSKSAQKSLLGENRLVVHEWGTFTSIAGKDGVALEWRPLNGPTDLPKFLNRSSRAFSKTKETVPSASASGN